MTDDESREFGEEDIAVVLELCPKGRAERRHVFYHMGDGYLRVEQARSRGEWREVGSEPVSAVSVRDER